MKALIALTAFAALFIGIACSEPEPRTRVVTPTPRPDTAPTTAPTVKPTIPRIEFSATAEARATTTPPEDAKPAPTNTPTTLETQADANTSTATLRDPNHPIAQLVPLNPEFDDSVHLRDIYAQIDLNQFALDPTQPINWLQDPNCDYNVDTRRLTENFQLNRQRAFQFIGTVGYCNPIAIDANHVPILGGATIDRQPIETTVQPNHEVLNTTPLDTILQHPYLFAFNNTQLYAKHRPDPERIRFAANYSPALPQHTSKNTSASLITHYDNAGVQLPSSVSGIEGWLNSSWYVPITARPATHTFFPKPMGLWHEDSLGNEISRHVIAMLEQASEEANTGFELDWTNARRAWTPKIPDLRQAVILPERNASQAPIVQWEFLSPYLPIIRVTTYAEQHLPFGPPVTHQDYRYGTEFQFPDARSQLTPTRYAVSFVISLQQTWENFQDPKRIDRYDVTSRIPKGTSWQFVRYQLRPEHAQRWYPSDFMQHRLIGPIVLQVFESDYIQPGVYSRNPTDHTWDLPTFPESITPIFESNPRANQDSQEVIDAESAYYVEIDDPENWHNALGSGLYPKFFPDSPTPGLLPSFPTEMINSLQETHVSDEMLRAATSCDERIGVEWQANCYAALRETLANAHQRLHDHIYQGYTLPK